MVFRFSDGYLRTGTRAGERDVSAITSSIQLPRRSGFRFCPFPILNLKHSFLDSDHAKYLVAQKSHSGSSIRCHWKTWINCLTNPTLITDAFMTLLLSMLLVPLPVSICLSSPLFLANYDSTARERSCCCCLVAMSCLTLLRTHGL